MTKASPARRKRRTKAPDAESEAAGGPGADAEAEAGGIAPILPDCNCCRRSGNCAVWLSFVDAVNGALGNASTRIPGIELKPNLTIIKCPEFDMTPEMEAKLREQMIPMPEPEPAPEE